MVKPRPKLVQDQSSDRNQRDINTSETASNMAPPGGDDEEEGADGLASVLVMHDSPAMTPRDDIYNAGHSKDPRLYVITEGNSTLSTDMYEIEKAKMKEQESKIGEPIVENPEAESKVNTETSENLESEVKSDQNIKKTGKTNVRKSVANANNPKPKLRGSTARKSPIKRSTSEKSKSGATNSPIKRASSETPSERASRQSSINNSVPNTPVIPDTAPSPNRSRRLSNTSQASHASVDIQSTGGWDTPSSSIPESGFSSRIESRTEDDTPRSQLKLTQVKCAWMTGARSAASEDMSSRSVMSDTISLLSARSASPESDVLSMRWSAFSSLSYYSLDSLEDIRSSTTLSSAAPTDASDDLDDHINVVVRIRPLNSQELSRRDSFAVTFHGSGRLEVAPFQAASKQFGFNVVFEPEATQEDVFNHSGVKKLIDMALNGYACTALAFGQTGSGKTHTMTGPPQQFEGGKHPDPEMVGIMQRSFSYLLSQSSQIQGNKVIRASYLEIYNEQVIDLLNPNQKKYLQVRWSKNKGFYVENLFVAECENVDDLMAVLEEGMRNRQTGSHGLNEFSSRSHSMLTLTIDTEQQDPDDENLYLTKRGKLTFVDLAGSEKVKDSESTDKTLVESNNINRSLLVLGNCISSLGDPKKRQGHIPYRDSKLTKLLADSLGGNGVTLMVACVTPSSHHASETINTLRYASRAKKIKTKPVVKMDPREKLILSLKREIKILRNENVYLRQQLEFPAKPKGALQKENDEKFMKFLKQGKEVGNTGPPVASNKGEAGLYEMLQEYMIENEALRSENSEMHSTKDRIKREQQLMYRENERLQKRIEALERGQGGISRPMNGPPPQHDPYYDPPRQSPVNRPPPGPGGQQWRNANPQRQPLAEPYPVGQQNIPPNARGKQPPPAGPKRPPHRLPDNIPHRTPPNMSQDPMQNGGYHDDGYMSPRGRPPLQNGPMRQVFMDDDRLSTGHESPMRYPDSRRSSQASASDSIRTMNEKLKQEIMELEGEIEHHHMVNQRNKSIYGSQTSVRSGPR